MSASPALPTRPSRPRHGELRARRTPNVDAVEPDRNAWIGVDFARFGSRPVSRSWVPLAMLALLAALAVAALRIDLIRTRYALADALEREQTLISEQRALIAEQRRLREPTTQAARAGALGLRPAETVYFVVDPSSAGREAVDRPAVAAGPPVLRAWRDDEAAGAREATAGAREAAATAGEGPLR